MYKKKNTMREIKVRVALYESGGEFVDWALKELIAFLRGSNLVEKLTQRIR